VGDLEASAIKLRTFADRVRTAPRGYSPLFAAVKISAEELAKLYEYDATLLGKTEEIEQAIGNVQSSVGTDGLPAAISNLETVAVMHRSLRSTGRRGCCTIIKKSVEIQHTRRDSHARIFDIIEYPNEMRNEIASIS
jgi:hypothetical protein